MNYLNFNNLSNKYAGKIGADGLITELLVEFAALLVLVINILLIKYILLWVSSEMV